MIERTMSNGFGAISKSTERQNFALVTPVDVMRRLVKPIASIHGLLSPPVFALAGEQLSCGLGFRRQRPAMQNGGHARPWEGDDPVVHDVLREGAVRRKYALSREFAAECDAISARVEHPGSRHPTRPITSSVAMVATRAGSPKADATVKPSRSREQARAPSRLVTARIGNIVVEVGM